MNELLEQFGYLADIYINGMTAERISLSYTSKIICTTDLRGSIVLGPGDYDIMCINDRWIYRQTR